ncbi:hypothetical protein Mapa_003043 [Marchantia paleacea]|nr:hypothetical protein Mapa_003043 [Marchantia paleacea]
MNVLLVLLSTPTTIRCERTSLNYFQSSLSGLELSCDHDVDDANVEVRDDIESFVGNLYEVTVQGINYG